MAESSLRARLLSVLAGPLAGPPLSAVRSAAIALVLLEHSSDLEFLLIERAQRDGDPWSGHMALPGGHAEPGDTDLAATAERETLEEIGLDLRIAGELVGQLSDCAPMRAVPIAVRPFVYLLSARPTLVLSEEVKQALWVPVGPLLSGEYASSYAFSRAGRETQLPAWNVAGHVVWGLTYRVLDEFLRRFNQVSAAGAAALDNS